MIKCGKCGAHHGSVAAVKACHAGDLFACHWMVEVPGRWVEYDEEPDGQYIEGGIQDCGAEAIATDRGWTCAGGHEHVTAEARHAEQWDYAETYEEAAGMYKAGVEPFTMSGHIVTGPQDFAYA